MAKKMDYQFTKTKIFPKVIITLKDTSIEIRKDSLKALLAILNLIDSQTISSTVLPAIEACRKISSDNYINAITVHIYNMLSATLSP